MTIQQAIEKAVVGGYSLPGDRNIVINLNARRFGEVRAKHMYLCSVFLDPLFWQSLGKAMGWEEEWKVSGVVAMIEPRWRYEWHRFIDKLANGGTAEQFFQEL